MKYLIKSIVLFFFAFILSCNSSKSLSKNTIEEYKKKGYVLGLIEPKKNGDCNYVITMIGSDLKYDPINIANEKFTQFLSKKNTILFTFSRLRMKNRCDNISPIRLIDVVSK